MTDMTVQAATSAPAQAAPAAAGATEAGVNVAQLLNVKDQVHLSPEGRALMERQANDAQALEESTDGREKAKKTKDPH